MKSILNKRGVENLLNKFLGIVIAIICVVFLISFVVRIFFLKPISEEKKQAEASMSNLISAEISRINEGGVENPSGVFVQTPVNWYIMSFTEDKKPNLCTGLNCICLCKKVIVDLSNRQEKECDKNGVCEIVPNLKSFEKIKIEQEGISISIKKNLELIEVGKYGN